MGARNLGLGQAATDILKAEAPDARSGCSPSSDHGGRRYGRRANSSGLTSCSNAGINDPADGPPATVDLSAGRRLTETIFFGTLAVTLAMLPPSASRRQLASSVSPAALARSNETPIRIGDPLQLAFVAELAPMTCAATSSCALARRALPRTVSINAAIRIVA